MNLPRILAASWLLLAPVLAAAATTTTVVDLPVGGTTLRFLYVKPDAPVANLVSLSGNDGILGIQPDGRMTTRTATCSPVARNREALANAGIAVALLDASPQGVPPGLAESEAAIAYLRARADVPAWIAGGSSSTATVADVAARLPASIPAGALFFSPMRLPAALMESVRRPAFVLSHSGDELAFGSALFNGLVNAVPKERLVLTGGTDSDCGFHLFQGLDAEYVAATTSFMTRNNAATASSETKFSALWYAFPAESEPGWGVNVVHQGDIVFATWFTYDAAGPMWLVMPNMPRISGSLFRGPVYRTTGPAFDSAPFDPSRVGYSEVGTASLDFADESRATFAYTVNGISGTEPITRQVFSSPVPRCTAGASPSATNFQDLWWMPAESGWGVNVAHQGDILFATWFTYGADGRGRWLVMPGMQRVAGTSRYAGDVFQTSGPPFSAYDPAGLSFSRVGTASFDFTGASTATFGYTVDGVTQSKPVTRQAFSATTVCQ